MILDQISDRAFENVVPGVAHEEGVVAGGVVVDFQRRLDAHLPQKVGHVANDLQKGIIQISIIRGCVICFCTSERKRMKFALKLLLFTFTGQQNKTRNSAKCRIEKERVK